MTERRHVQTIGGAEVALSALNDSGGLLNKPAMTGLKSDLPFDTGDYPPGEENTLLDLIVQVTGNSETEEGFVSIWKKDERTSKFDYVGKVGARDFSEAGPHDFLADNFGAGEYELRVYDSNKKLFKRPRTTVSKLAEEYSKRKRAQVPAQPGGGEIAQLAKVMQEGFLQLGQMVATRTAPPAPESRTQILQEMLQMKQIFGGGNSSDPITMFTQMAGLFKSMQPRPDNEGGMFMDLVDRFTPVIAEAMKNHQAALPAPGAQPAQIAQPGARPAQPAQQRPAQQLTPEQTGAHQMSMQLKIQLGFLCSQAAMKADPGPWAAIIAEQVPREVLTALANDENWLEALAKHNPKVKDFPEWFDELHECVIDELEERGAESNENLREQGTSDIQAPNLPGGDDVSGGDGDEFS